MNKVQVGFAPSPNLKAVHSKIGSLANANYKPGGGDKKIESRKLEYNAKSKVGSILNMKHVPGGGNVKVLSHFIQQHSKLLASNFNAYF